MSGWSPEGAGVANPSIAAEVVVVGAGPAGSACAAELARAGRDVLLLDRATFPRDKTCGDGLIPDAIAALDRLGVLDAVRATASARDAITFHSARGTPLTLGGEFLTIPRRELDSVLVDRAVACGARFEQRVRVHDIEPGGRGATVHARRDRRELAFTAPLVVLATGAAGGHPAIYRRARLEQPAPSALAARCYLRVGDEALPDGLLISYDVSLCPGYGWIFPVPGGLVNVGAAWFGNRPCEGNLREVWQRFVARFAPARRLSAVGEVIGSLRGAPLAMGMHRPMRPSPAVVTIGEAAGLTFPASGEGIGKALESGLSLADALAPVPPSVAAMAAAADDFVVRWAREKRGLYRGYEAAQGWLARPYVSDFVARRATCRPRLRERLEGVISETVDPARLISLPGFLRALLA